MLVTATRTSSTSNAEYVVHPPLGKVMIAIGEAMFGLTPFGWRFSVPWSGRGDPDDRPDRHAG